MGYSSRSMLARSSVPSHTPSHQQMIGNPFCGLVDGVEPPLSSLRSQLLDKCRWRLLASHSVPTLVLLPRSIFDIFSSLGTSQGLSFKGCTNTCEEEEVMLLGLPETTPLARPKPELPAARIAVHFYLPLQNFKMVIRPE